MKINEEQEHQKSAQGRGKLAELKTQLQNRGDRKQTGIATEANVPIRSQTENATEDLNQGKIEITVNEIATK